MTRFNFITSLVLFTLLNNVSFAQQAVISEELVQLVNTSFTYNPRIAELQQGVSIQEERMDVAYTYLLPSVNASAAYNYVDPIGEATFPVGPGVEKTIQFQPHNNISFGLGLNYQLLDFGRARSNINKVKNELELSKENVEYNKAQLASQVAGIYFGVVYLKNAISVQDSIISALGQAKKVMENRLKNGDALELDVLTIGSNEDAEQNRKIELENLLQKQLNLLAFSTGVNTINAPGNNFVFNTALGSSDDLLKQAEANNLDFKIAQQKIALSHNDWNIAKTNYYPSLNVLGNAGMRNGYQPSIDDLKFNYLVGLSFSAPIFQGGRYKQQQQLSEANTKLNELSLNTLRNNYQRDINQAIADAKSYEARVENAKGQVAQAEKALELTSSKYKNGIALQIEFLNALNTLQKIKLSVLNFQYQACLSQVELTRLQGTKWW